MRKPEHHDHGRRPSALLLHDAQFLDLTVEIFVRREFGRQIDTRSKLAKPQRSAHRCTLRLPRHARPPDGRSGRRGYRGADALHLVGCDGRCDASFARRDAARSFAQRHLCGHGARDSGEVHGLVVVPEETVTSPCSPTLAKSFRKSVDFLDQTLIRSDVKQVQCHQWFAANGLEAPTLHGMRFDRSFLAIATAAESLGRRWNQTLLAKRERAIGGSIDWTCQPYPLCRSPLDLPPRKPTKTRRWELLRIESWRNSAAGMSTPRDEPHAA